MKNWFVVAAVLSFTQIIFAQEEVIIEEKEETEEIFFEEEGPGVPDTTRMNFGNKEVIIVTRSAEEIEEYDIEFDEDHDVRKPKTSEAHWAGVDFGFTMLMNDNFGTDFANHPYWENDAARSQVWNLNLLEHKFNFGTPYVGLTTGLGFSFTGVAFNDNYVLSADADTVFASIDTVNSYTKNKLRASYLTVPLMLEFNTNANSNKSFYLAAGVVGGVRLTSRVKRNGEFQGRDFEERIKGRYALNSFRLDAAVRMGYQDWGIFANYNMLPMFDQGKTVSVHPLTFGLSYNF